MTKNARENLALAGVVVVLCTFVSLIIWSMGGL